MSRLPYIVTCCGRWAFLLVVLLVAPSAAGQVLYGRITGVDQAPIPGATVLFEGTTRGTAADADGWYQLSPAPVGTFSIRYSAVGHITHKQTVRIAAGDSIRVDVRLGEQVLSSDEVVVTASRREQAAMSVPVSMAVLGQRDLEARNAVSLDEVLETVSGVQIMDNQVNIRGSSGFAYNTGSRVLMMVDGMPLMTPDQDGVPLEALPSSQIERIEVLKGPGSALYGSGAMGGVINVITRDVPDSPETHVQAFAGVYQPFRHRVWRESWEHGSEMRPFTGASVSHARGLGSKFGWWANVTWRKDTGFLAFSEKTSVHGFAKLGWRPTPAHRLDLLLGTLFRQRDLFLFWQSGREALQPGVITIGSDEEGDPTSPTGTTDDYVNQLSFLPSYTHIVGPNFYYTIRARVFGTYIRPIDNETGRLKPLSEGSVGFRYGTEVQANWLPSPTRRMTLGASFDALTTRNSFFVTTDGDELGGQPEVAAFLHVEQSLPYGVELVGGARFDSYQIDKARTESHLSPKFSVAWQLDPAVMLRFAMGDGFRVPSFAERFTDNNDFLPIVRNLELKPERSRTMEIGARTRLRSDPTGDWHVDFTAFRSSYRDFIEPRLSTQLQAFQFQNLPRTRILGLETTLEWSAPSGRVGGRAGYTLLETKELDSGLELPFRPKHQFTLSLDGIVAGPISAGLDYRILSRPGRVETDFARFVRDAELLVATRLLDVRVSVEHGPWKAAVIVDNALHYQFLERPAMLGAPRNVTFQLTWKTRGTQ